MKLVDLLTEAKKMAEAHILKEAYISRQEMRNAITASGYDKHNETWEFVYADARRLGLSVEKRGDEYRVWLLD